MKEKKFKVGDKVKCVEGFGDILIVGAEYVISKLDGVYVYVDEKNHCSSNWYASRFVLVESAKDAFEQKLIKAYKLIGQSVYWKGFNGKIESFVVVSIDVRADKIKLYDSDGTWLFYDEAIEKSADIKVKLNSKYDAIVSKDSIVVGCQIFPISILDDLVKAKDELGKF